MPLSRSVVPTAIGSGTWNPGFIALAWVLWEKLGTGAGGTRTRAAVVDEAGRLRGAASGPGANPVSHAPERAVGALAGTLQAGLDAAEVRGLVLGLAGAGRGGLAVAEPARAAGLSCPVRVVGDAVTAFAAGTAEPDGTVPVAGAGAAAARIVARREAVVADGNGWLLGDDGSGFWLGREAVRAALAALDGRGAATAAYAIAPDLALVLEGTTCADIPGNEAHRQSTRLGDGPALTVMDRAHIPPRWLVDRLAAAAERRHLPYQWKRTTAGGTDAGPIHLSRTGVPTAVVSVPCRYIHGPCAVISCQDFEAAQGLVRGFLEDLGEGGWSPDAAG